MLKELRIKDFAIIDSINLEFGSGLVILTGETGAGKSILIDALLMVMGASADISFIRAGCEKAQVEATFALDAIKDTALIEVLRAESLLDESDLTMILSRELRDSNRSVARVNGSQVRASLLRELGEYVVDIHGQAEHLSLLNVRKHIELLDRYAHNEDGLKQYQHDYSALHAIRKELAELREAQLDAARRLDILSFQAEEIENAGIKTDEDEIVKQERDRLANAESLSKRAAQSLMLIGDGDGRIPPILDLMGEVSEALQDLAKMDISQLEMANQSEVILDTLSEMERQLRLYVDAVEYNPRRLDQLEDRLDLLNRLKRKYGGTLAAVLAYGEKCRADMESLNSADERIAELEAMEQGQLSLLGEKALALSAARVQASAALGKGIEKELNDLGMGGARFQVEIRHPNDPNGIVLPDGRRVAFTERGIDLVEFMIAPNQGEGFKPLVKTASGGETARLMLALKNVLVEADTVPTLIFDEIDQGIGGRLGMVVGEKLWRLGREHQVLCVTHLPQLAAFGDHHYRVEKHLTDDERTTTRVQGVSGDSRSNELAEMLGGVREVNQKAARDLISIAQKRQMELAAAI